MLLYGLLLEDGRGTATSKREASRYYKMAADKGQVNATVNYGQMKCKGRGITSNEEESARYLTGIR
ncbi:hypothetical protein M9Y10_043325 [Tritrichomonas musculus]|uniref:Sel1 repeat family protein n=1 Tax=Tritrichomonas musculus TaxID=1915356 RepID=A0ABR2JZC4_9EUKA